MRPCTVSWRWVAGAAAGLVLLWVLALLALWRVTPRGERLRDAVRLVPDVLVLVSRLARERSLPRGVRLRLWLLLAYLALPIDLVPDLVPVLGYADDAVLLVWTLRAVVRRAGLDVVAEHWPGTPEGLIVVTRLTGLTR